MQGEQNLIDEQLPASHTEVQPPPDAPSAIDAMATIQQRDEPLIEETKE